MVRKLLWYHSITYKFFVVLKIMRLFKIYAVVLWICSFVNKKNLQWEILLCKLFSCKYRKWIHPIENHQLSIILFFANTWRIQRYLFRCALNIISKTEECNVHLEISNAGTRILLNLLKKSFLYIKRTLFMLMFHTTAAFKDYSIAQQSHT